MKREFIHDPVTSGGWESSQLALIKGLLPYIRQFVRVRQALVGAEALGASVADLLDSSRLGVIHLDRRGQIIEANDRARAILRHGDGLSDRGGELWARAPADHAHLEGLLAGALPSAGVGVSGSMLLRRPSGVLPLVVHVKPVVGPQPDYGAAGQLHPLASEAHLSQAGRRPAGRVGAVGGGDHRICLTATAPVRPPRFRHLSTST